MAIYSLHFSAQQQNNFKVKLAVPSPDVLLSALRVSLQSQCEGYDGDGGALLITLLLPFPHNIRSGTAGRSMATRHPGSAL